MRINDLKSGGNLLGENFGDRKFGCILSGYFLGIWIRVRIYYYNFFYFRV